MEKTRFRTFINICLVIALFTAFHYLGWLKFLENFFRKIINPGSEFLYKIHVNINNESFSSVDELQTAYTTLKEQFLKNQIDIAQLEILKDENYQLRAQLNYLQKQSFSHLGADVIGKNVDPFGNNLIINRGEIEGIKVGQPVIILDGILIGQITRVESEISIVRLINDNQSKIAASILDKDKSLGLIEGGYGISVQMNFIPQNEIISVGDMVVSSGLQKEIPKGLLIGKVEAIEKEAYQPFQKAIISPLKDLNKIDLVTILL